MVQKKLLTDNCEGKSLASVRRKVILICTLVLVFAMAVRVSGTADTNGKIKVMFLRGGGHDWKGCPPILKSVLHRTNDFEVLFTENLNDLKERIKQFDIIVQYTGGLNLNKEQETGLCDFIQNGGGYVGIHSATDSFRNSDRFWEMVGGRFSKHGGGKFVVHIDDLNHPITRGMKDFEIEDETYRHDYHPNAQVRSLTRMNRGEEKQSMSWVSSYGKGKVFYTSYGHDRKAWINPQFQRLVVRGMYWAAGRKVKDLNTGKTANAGDVGPNKITETFNGGFDNPIWSKSDGGTFSSTTYDLSRPVGKVGAEGCNISDFDIIGGPGSFQSEVIWKNIDFNGSGGVVGGWVLLDMKVTVDSAAGSEMSMSLGNYYGKLRMNCGIMDNTVGTWWFDGGEFIPVGSQYSELRMYIDLTVNAPGDWQVDFSYDIGGGKTLLGSMDEMDLMSFSTFDPTAAKYRCSMGIYCGLEDDSISVSLDNFRLWPK